MDRAPRGPVNPGGRARSRPDLDGYEIRAYTTRDEADVLDLLAITVGETPGSRKHADFWRWKHARSPFGPSFALCAWTPDGRLVGFRTLMWWSFRTCDGLDVRATRPVDTATHPDHRRRGIFSALTNLAVEDLAGRGAVMMFNTPNANSLPGYVKMGWEVVARWPVYVKPVRWSRLAGGLGAKLTGRRWLPANGSDRTAGDRSDQTPTWREVRRSLGRELLEFLRESERYRAARGLRTVRDAPYLDWRYGSHPDVAYRTITSRTRGELGGVAIGRKVAGFGGSRAFLVTELFLREPSATLGARVLRSVARRSGCDYLLAHFPPGTAEHRALLRAGFVRAPGKGYTFVARPLAPVAPDPARPASWDLSLGELEIF